MKFKSGAANKRRQCHKKIRRHRNAAPPDLIQPIKPIQRIQLLLQPLLQLLLHLAPDCYQPDQPSAHQPCCGRDGNGIPKNLYMGS
jgi:hypothetical protein